MAHRRCVQDRVAGRDGIDLAEIGVARRRQHAMGQHRALRTAGRAGGVEQPGEIVSVARNDLDRVGGEKLFELGAADDDDALQTVRCVRRDHAVESVGCKAHPRAGLFEDVAKLGAVQLGIGRHGGEPRMPDRIKNLDIVRAILGGDGDAVARLEAKACQRAREPRGTARRLAVGSQHAGADAERRTLRIGEAGAIEPHGQVHRLIAPPSFRPSQRSAQSAAR